MEKIIQIITTYNISMLVIILIYLKILYIQKVVVNSIEKRRYLVTTNNTISKRSYTNVKNFKENELRYQFKYKSIDSFDVNYLKYLFNILNSFYKHFMKYTDSILIKLVLAENKNIGFDSESTNKGVSIIDYYLTLFDDDFYRYEIENIQNTFHKRSYLFSRESEEINKTPEFLYLMVI